MQEGESHAENTETLATSQLLLEITQEAGHRELGPRPRRLRSKTSHPQSRILHLHEDHPTVLVTQNHAVRLNANSFAKLGNGWGKSFTALGLELL